MRFYHLLVVAFVGLCLACGNPSGSGAGRKTYTERELYDVVRGKTPEQVIVILGRPEATFGHIDTQGEGTFRYRDIVANPHTGGVDNALIQFKNGRATGAP